MPLSLERDPYPINCGVVSRIPFRGKTCPVPGHVEHLDKHIFKLVLAEGLRRETVMHTYCVTKILKRYLIEEIGVAKSEAMFRTKDRHDSM